MVRRCSFFPAAACKRPRSRRRLFSSSCMSALTSSFVFSLLLPDSAPSPLLLLSFSADDFVTVLARSGAALSSSSFSASAGGGAGAPPPRGLATFLHARVSVAPGAPASPEPSDSSSDESSRSRYDDDVSVSDCRSRGNSTITSFSSHGGAFNDGRQSVLMGQTCIQNCLSYTSILIEIAV